MEWRRLAFVITLAACLSLNTKALADTWGFADIEAAVASITLWIESVAWSGPGVDLDRWYIVGHSNGGRHFHNGLVMFGLGTNI